MRSLTIRAVRPETPRTRVVEVALDTRDWSFRAGQAVMLTRPGAEPIPFSIASPPSAARRGSVEFLMTADTAFGEGGDVLSLAGATVEMSEPFGSFGVPANETHLPLALVAGGTGVAPIRSVLLDVLEGSPLLTPILVYSARAGDEFAFDGELEALRREGRLDYHKTLTGTGTPDWQGRTGRIDAALLRSLWPHGETCTLVCGPADFVAAVRDALGAIGVRPDRVVVER